MSKARKQQTRANNFTSSIYQLQNKGYNERILSNFIDSNSLAMSNFVHLTQSMSDAVSKNAFAKQMMRYTDNVNTDGYTKVGPYYPIGIQAVYPFDYSYKPFGHEVLDFNPVTGEFITYEMQEWRKQTRYYKNNTMPELMKFLPMGMELELIYRGSSRQCMDCENYDAENDYEESTYCETDECYSQDRDNAPYINRKDILREMFKFLAILNVSFGAYGTSSNPVWIAKQDSSVDIEFVSMPMTIRAFKAGLIIAETQFKAFKNAGKVAKGYYGPCGGHIHLDKDSFTNTFQYYAFLSMHYDNPKLIASIAQRSVGEDNQWAYLYKPNDFARVVKYKLNSASRQAVSVNSTTVELRYFRSNLKINRLLKNVEFIQAMYEFTTAMTYQDLARFKQNSVTNFMLFIRANRYRFPNLFNFFVVRKWIKKEKLVNSVKNFESTTQVFYEDINSNQYQRDDQLFQQQEWNNETAEGRLLNSIFGQDNLNGYEREDN